ncbi:PD-(D/E)XK nuclease family protein [Hydrogenophaga sp. RWCD_12]|uniref:PD-(D/E)XK nuclease family protein n=1 Tax=Hydrogenophaga sp. RWCD_12 TaxID=3391190 RepID=UPI00398519BC
MPSSDHPTGYGSITPAGADWPACIRHLDDRLARQELAPGRLVVLLPYLQLVEPARRAWATAHPSGFGPRFETTRSWASGLAPWWPAPTDVSGDMARDSLVAEAMVVRMVKGSADPALRAVLVSRLVDAVRSVAPLAAARPPAQRAAWAGEQREALGQGPHWESLVASLALAWAGNASYPTDVLWGDTAAPGVVADRIWLLQGFQHDPLGLALGTHWGERAEVSDLFSLLAGDATAAPRALTLQSCADAEEEAQRTAASVIARINEGGFPLALVANDRRLTRRVSAMLSGAGVSLCDETGWKLSTTHAAAQIMAVLRAADARARMDDVLDLLKQGSAWPPAQVEALELAAREAGISAWKAAAQHAVLAPLIPEGFAALLESLQVARPLERWLDALRAALQSGGLWERLAADAAGQGAIRALRLDEGASEELLQVGLAVAETGRPGARLGLSAFSAWVRDVLEGASFKPAADPQAQVVILPLSQLLGRGFSTVVMPGCDELTLDPDPGQQSPWTASQCEQLGLPGRTALMEGQAQAWQAALRAPQVDILWRRQEGGEPLSPSPWVMALPGFDDRQAGANTFCAPRPLCTVVVAHPLPVAPDLMPSALSASAYQDLRDCPYRFFALRQLRLSEADELEAEPDQRDLGNWLHAVLRRFHEERGDGRPGRDIDARRLDQIGEEIATEMGLQVDEGGAGFLPYQAVWPALREGYLDWLAGHEGSDERPGPMFARAEAELSVTLPPWRLYGKLDRIDQQSSPEGPLPLVIDYKTESRDKTNKRVKDPFEDTQLAFYAALLPDENLRAAYLSITDGRSASGREGATHLVEQPLVLQAREQLREGIVQDLGRVAAGHALPALGEGLVCEYCAARGLCRKDFWSTP